MTSANLVEMLGESHHLIKIEKWKHFEEFFKNKNISFKRLPMFSLYVMGKYQIFALFCHDKDC